jgi:hypothetical protein
VNTSSLEEREAAGATRAPFHLCLETPVSVLRMAAVDASDTERLMRDLRPKRGLAGRHDEMHRGRIIPVMIAFGRMLWVVTSGNGSKK